MKEEIIKVTVKGNSFTGVVVDETNTHLLVKVGKHTIKVSKTSDIVIINF